MMTPDRKLLEAALEGYAIQRKAIEVRESEIREVLKSPVEVMAEAMSRAMGPDLSDLKGLKTYPLSRPKRKMSAAGRAAISRATKARWAKYRKEHKK